MNTENRNAQSVFAEALRMRVPAERQAYLDRACGSDEALRQEVESLLNAHEQAGAFLQPTVALALPNAPAEKPGDRIGRYKLLEQIGEGGFGVVWMAEQEEPVRRRVALKIIKLGMDTREVVARFEAERQALAMMDHPGIASVFDGGATGTGRPYFVMELVKGVPITSYCDANKLSPHQRLELFIGVCQAVQHAHQKGVIHRDLKPTNILVTEKDDRPVPKVIDFGVAKATQARLTEKTLFTQFRQWIGTPAYMSPEQAGLASLDVDTRSDVYSLGVVLYELLTGRTTFDTKKLLDKGYEAVMQTIREEEPLKPSTRLITLAKEELGAVAASRDSEPARLSRLVRGDLDWIVMKALEKDRKRRYDSPGTLAQDIARHLNSEPVLATPPSVGYSFQKYVRRHRLGVSLGVVIALTVLAGAGMSLWQAMVARQQARLAESRRREAEASRLAATESERQVERSARELSHQLASHYVDNGVQRLDEGNYCAALLWFTEALRLDEGDPAAEAPHRLRIATVLKQCPSVLALLLHAKPVVSVEFSPDGQRLVTASLDGTARVWDANTGAPLTPSLQHTNYVACASFSPDGRRIVTASFDHTARIWDAHTSAPLTPPMEHGSNVWSAAFSPDGRRVVTASEDKTARVWDVATGQAVTPPLRHEEAVWPAAFSPDGRLVLTASQDKTARIWNAETGRPATPALQHAGMVCWAAFSPNGLLVATASEDHTARVWDAHSGAPVTSPLQHGLGVVYVAFSPDSKRLVTATGQCIAPLRSRADDFPSEARVWEVASARLLTPAMRHEGTVFCAVFSPDGRRLATASADKTARVWDAQTGEPVSAPFPHAQGVFRAVFTPDSRRVATASFDGAARIWDVPDDKPTTLRLKESWLAGRYSFSPDGRLVTGTFIGNSAAVWDALTGSRNTPLIHGTNVHRIALSGDNRLVATAGADNAARIWDAHGGAATIPPLVHEAEVNWVDFSPDCQRVVTASADHTARVWDVHTGAESHRLQHAGDVRCAAFSPDGRRVVTASEDHTARVWDASTGYAVTPPLAHNDAVRLAVFSPDGRRVLTGCRDGKAQVWDAGTGAPITLPMKQAGEVFISPGIKAMCFSPDGYRIVIADSDGTARVWNADTGELVAPALQHGDSIACGAFSHDGRLVVTGSWDKTARVWDAVTGQPVTLPLPQDGPVEGARFAPDDRSLQTAGHSDRGGIILTRNLTPDERPAKELVRLAQLLSLHRLDSRGSLIPLEFEMLTNAFPSLRP
ncbi:MAG TPA: protein kinase [Candidatus Acidoferrum sp.]|nr:protein kinase [Candidatus Acidoferrum sp.]